MAETKFPIKTKAKFGETKIYLYNPPEHKVEAEVPCEKGAATGAINNSREETVDPELLRLQGTADRQIPRSVQLAR